MKKRLSKILWFGDALNENNQAAPPALSPSDEEHLQGLNLGEIYICVADADPALFIRTSADRIVYFKALDIEALSKFFIRKDRPDEAGFLIKFLGGLFSDYIQSMNFSSGALGEGFVIKVDSKTGDSYLEVDHMLARKSATFIELLIQRLRQVGGQIILSPASMSCSKVEEYDTFYRCYFENTDGEKTIVQEFVIGDQARSQTFNIKPGVHGNVSNTYYWRLVTSVGDNYIDLSKSDCDTGSAAPQAGDDIVQLGNRTDKTRQNAIVLAAYGNDTPSFRQYAGIDSYSLTGKEVTAFSPNGNKVTGDFILKTGVNILTQFKILEDLIYSEISKVLDEVQAKDNYLYNASFASNTNGWETKNDVRFFTVNGKFLLVNGEFYSRKDAMAAIIRDGDRNVLRILSSGIKQSNADLANKPTYEEGEEPKKFFISFRYRVATAGTLAIGFPGQNLHFTERLEPGEEYAMKEYSGTWDGTGDFELKFTGDIYIHSLALTENAFEDLYTKLSSEIEQTAENLKLSVTKIEEDVTQLGLDINGVTEELKLYVKKDGLGSEINVALDNISVVSKNIYFTGDISANGNVSIQADGTIKAIGGYFEGEINANSGVFKNVRTPNNSLVIDENGNVSIVGKISTASSGTKIEIDPNTNSIRMYNQNGKEVGGINFMVEEWGGSNNYYPKIRLHTYHGDEEISDVSLSGGNISISVNMGGHNYFCNLEPRAGLFFYKDNIRTKSYPAN